MNEKRMRGLVIAAITPMNEDGSVDEQSVANFAKFLVEAGVNCLYPNGTNGESLLLTREEREKIAEIMVKTSRGRVPVFIQCGAMSTAEATSHAQHAVKIGADGIGIMTPAFFTVDEEALFQYYSDIVTPLPKDFPVYIYNIPGCTANDVSPALLNRLLNAFPNIKGIKFSKPDLMRAEDYLEQSDRRPDLLIGCDSLYLQCLTLGGTGTVTGPGSVFHERFTRLYRQYNEGDLAGAIETQRRIVKTDRELASIPGIPALKTLLKLRGVIKTDVCRAPLRALTESEHDTLKRVWEAYAKEE
ncbi:MAG: dihydrodipicolinate synthase family protein, partial [Oscillospiraceae bacterium]|nr:dihydrodipicolinate synthase family protein [Oscillospiraceae bacterium]